MRSPSARDRMAEDRRALDWQERLDEAEVDRVLGISDVRRLRMLPGDALIVTVPAAEVTLQQADAMARGLKQALDGRKVVVVMGPAEYVVLPPAPGAAPLAGGMTAQHYPDGAIVLRPESAES